MTRIASPLSSLPAPLVAFAPVPKAVAKPPPSDRMDARAQPSAGSKPVQSAIPAGKSIKPGDELYRLILPGVGEVSIVAKASGEFTAFLIDKGKKTPLGGAQFFRQFDTQPPCFEIAADQGRVQIFPGSHVVYTPPAADAAEDPYDASKSIRLPLPQNSAADAFVRKSLAPASLSGVKAGTVVLKAEASVIGQIPAASDEARLQELHDGYFAFDPLSVPKDSFANFLCKLYHLDPTDDSVRKLLASETIDIQASSWNTAWSKPGSAYVVKLPLVLELNLDTMKAQIEKLVDGDELRTIPGAELRPNVEAAGRTATRQSYPEQARQAYAKLVSAYDSAMKRGDYGQARALSFELVELTRALCALMRVDFSVEVGDGLSTAQVSALRQELYTCLRVLDRIAGVPDDLSDERARSAVGFNPNDPLEFLQLKRPSELFLASFANLDAVSQALAP